MLFTLSIASPTIMGITLNTDSVGFGEFQFTRDHQLPGAVLRPGDPQNKCAFTIKPASTVILVNVVAVLLAVGLTAKIRAKIAPARVAHVLPMVISGIVIAYVFALHPILGHRAAGQAVGITALGEPARQPGSSPG